MKKPSVPDIHTWFGLTYSSYLVLNRLAMDNMPIKWQQRLIILLDELEARQPDDMPSEYWVRAKKGNKFIKDPYSNYRYGKLKFIKRGDL